MRVLRLCGATFGALICIGLILSNLAPAAAAPLAAPLAAPVPDLQINKVGPNSISIGQRFTYTLNITNNTAGTLSGVVITDTWTAQDYDGSYTTTGSANVQSAVFVSQPIRYIQFNLAAMGPGATGSIGMGMVISTVHQPNISLAPLVVGNNALITTSTPGKTSNNDSVNTIVVGPVLNFLPHVSPGSVRPGRLVTFSFSLENRNRSDARDATNVVFTTTVPDWAEIYALHAPALATATVVNSAVVWQIPVIPVSTTTYVTLSARVLPTTTYGARSYVAAWCAGIADTQAYSVQCADQDYTNIDNVFEKPALTVSPPVQDSAVNQTFPARVVTYTIYVYNPFTQTVSLRITDTLPRYYNLADYSFQYLGLSNSNPNPPTKVTSLPGGIVGWTSPPITGWGVYSFTFNAWLPPTMPIPPNNSSYDFYNSVNGSYGDIMLPALVVNRYEWVVREVPQILVNKIVTPTVQIVGLPVTYTVVLSNNGPTIVRNIQITDVLPLNGSCDFSYKSALPGPAPIFTSTHLASWANITLTAYTQWSASFSVIASGQPYVSCYNAVVGFSPDSYIVEHDGLAPVLLDQPFGFAKTANRSTVFPGGQVQYTVTEKNTGGENAVMNGFTDFLPSGFLYGTSTIYTNSVGVPFTLLANSASVYQTTFTVNVASLPVPCDNLPYTVRQEVGTFGMVITSPQRLAGTWWNGASAAPVTVLPQIEVDNPTSPGVGVAGDVVTFTVVLSNNTNVAYSQMRVTDTLPTGIVFGGPLAGTPPPDVNAPQVAWTNQTVPPNGFLTLVFTGTVTGLNPGNFSHFAKASSDINPLVCAPKSTNSFTIGIALVTVLKKPSSATVGPLSKFTYDIVFYNFAPVAVTIASFTDTLPGLSGKWRYDSMQAGDPLPFSTNPPVWHNLMVPAGTNLHIHVNVRTGTEFGTFTNLQLTRPSPVGAGQFTGTIRAGWVLTSDGSFDGAPVTVVPGVGLDKIVSPGPVVNGDSVTYTITVVNLSAASIDNVVVTDSLPVGFSYEAWVSGIPPTTTSPLVWKLGTVQNGDSNKAVFSFRAHVSISEPTGIYYNRVNATSPSINIPPTDDIAPVQVNSNVGPHPNMILSKSDGRVVAALGDFVTYTIFYTNAGDAGASGILLTETAPANTSFTGPSVWTAVSGGRYTTTVADLTIGQGGSLTFSVQVTGTAPDGMYTNTVEVGALDEVARSDNTAIDVDLLQRLDAGVTVDDNVTNVAAGQIVTYVVGYTNTGNDQISNIVLTETLGTGLGYVGGAWTSAGGVFTLSVASLASGGSGSANLVAQVAAGIAGGSSVTNTAQIGFNGIDATPADNTATDVDYVSPSDLSLFQDDGVAIVSANQVLTYTFYYRNIGGTVANGAVISDVPAMQVTVQGSAGWTVNGGTYSYALPSLAPGASGSVILVARVNSGTAFGSVLTSTARISAGADSDPSNNESNDVDFVQASGPDLKITGVRTGVPALGLDDTIVMTVTNIGTASTTTWFYSDIYYDRAPTNRTDLGDDSNSQGAPAKRLPARVANLAPGQSVQFVYHHTFNDLLTHHLYFQADTCDTTGGLPNGVCEDASYGHIAETNEANNIYGPVSVSAVPPHIVNLPISVK